MLNKNIPYKDILQTQLHVNDQLFEKEFGGISKTQPPFFVLAFWSKC